MKAWLNYFDWNRKHRDAIPWESGVQVESHLRQPLIRSLQKFQIGESGEGRKLRRHAAETGDAAYAGAIDLFVKEEQEHARLMAEILKRMNAPLLKADWTDHCFVLLRHLFGLKQELMILLLPEMIAKRYFRALRDGTSNLVLRAVCAQILHDEDGHVTFHVEYLRRAFEGMSFSRRIVVQILWRIAFRATCLVVILGHRAIFRACGVSPGSFWYDCGKIFDETAAGIFTPPHLLIPTKLIAQTES